MPFQTPAAGNRPFKASIWISAVLHLSPLILLPLMGLFHSAPAPVRRAYFFEMVEPAAHAPAGAHRAAPPPPAPAAPKIAPAPPVAVKKTAAITAKRAVSNVKAALQEKAAPLPTRSVEEAPSAPPAEAAAEGALSNELTIGKPGFPFHFYEQQIMAAVERNWNPPQELLGAENQLVVVVKFEIQKDGSVINLSISESSWNSILDKLALRAVEKAKIPPIPGPDPNLSIAYRLVLKR